MLKSLFKKIFDRCSCKINWKIRPNTGLFHPQFSVKYFRWIHCFKSHCFLPKGETVRSHWFRWFDVKYSGESLSGNPMKSLWQHIFRFKENCNWIFSTANVNWSLLSIKQIKNVVHTLPDIVHQLASLLRFNRDFKIDIMKEAGPYWTTFWKWWEVVLVAWWRYNEI